MYVCVCADAAGLFVNTLLKDDLSKAFYQHSIDSMHVVLPTIPPHVSLGSLIVARGGESELFPIHNTRSCTETDREGGSEREGGGEREEKKSKHKYTAHTHDCTWHRRLIWCGG